MASVGLGLGARMRRWVTLIWLGLRLLFPSPGEWRYARQIRASGLLDRAYYLATNPRLPLICRIFPERHYVLRGEAVGLCPSAAFSPRAYSFFNPDQPGSGLPPLAHFIASRTGEGPSRITRDRPLGEMAEAAPLAEPLPLGLETADPATAPQAIVVHVYYQSMWPELAARIAAQSFAHDLFVTITGDGAGTAPLAARIRAEFPQARLWAMPNHGRDIHPFLHLVQSGALRPYQAICKLHTKQSPHRDDGDAWRRDLVTGILGAPDLTARRLQRFLDAPRAGIWVADGHVMRGPDWWGPNQPRSAELLSRVGLTAGRDELLFAAGSIYWIKPAVLDRLAALHLTAADFEPEMGQVDGTTAHAVERCLGLLVRPAGMEIVETASLDRRGE